MYSLISPYMIMFFALLVAAYIYRCVGDRGRRIVVGLCLTVFILFFGLRGEFGDDYSVYRYVYEEEPYAHFLSMPAYSVLMAVFRLLHIPFEGFIFACSCLINVLLFRFLWQRREYNIPFVLCVFLGMSGFIYEMDFIRNIISILLFANSLEYIKAGQPKKYLAVNAVGVLFHYSAILYLPLYYVLRRSMSWRVFTSLLVVAVVIGAIGIPYASLVPESTGADDTLMTHLSTYINTYTRAMPFTLASVERLFTALAVCMLYDDLEKDEYGRMGIWLFLFSFVCYGLFSRHAILATRSANLFVVCYWILWPLMARRMRTPRQRSAVGLVMTAYLMSRVISFSLLPQWHYSTILSK